ncbi:MAG: hypothetical protein ABF489_00395 [Bifidobacterium sp.]|uniref:DUF6941 family protein n=1 Tax=Bifidobacterium sp. TaxID=41200 RepID=UPI0039E95EEB
MSEISQTADLTIAIADFANVEQNVGKPNLIGGWGTIIPLTPMGVTIRFSVLSVIRVKAEYCPHEITLEVSLRDEDGNLVSLPGAVPNQEQPLRVANVVTIDAPTNGLKTDERNHIGGISNLVMDFSNGIPLAPGNYRWRLEIDGDEQNAAEYAFCVPGARPPIVQG